MIFGRRWLWSVFVLSESLLGQVIRYFKGHK